MVVSEKQEPDSNRAELQKLWGFDVTGPSGARRTPQNKQAVKYGKYLLAATLVFYVFSR